MRHIDPRTIAVLALIATGAVQAQEERLSTEWIYSEEGKTAESTPNHAWLDADTLVIYDRRRPKAERTLEVLDARNGRRRELVDGREVVENMTAILEPEDAIEEPGWPDAFSADGRWAAYEKSGDLVLLDLRNSDVSAIAVSDADESSPRFSPDSSCIAFVRDNDLYVRTLDDGAEKRLTFDGSDTLLNGKLSWVYWEELFNRADRGFAWAPDSSAIAYLQADDSGVDLMHYVDFKPGVPRTITQRDPQPGSPNPRVRAGVVDLAEAHTTWVDLGAYPYEYLVRMKWLPDGRRLAVQTLNRAQTKLDLFIADAASGDARHVMRESDDGWVDVHDDLYFLEDGRRFIWRSERDGHSHLYLFDMEGKLIRQITHGDWALWPSGGEPGMSRAVSYVDQDNEQVYFTALEKASTERHLYRVGLDGSGMERLSEGDGTHAILFSPGGAWYADRYSSLGRSPSLDIHGADGQQQNVVAQSRSDIRQRFGFLDWELFSIKASDGFEMPAMMLKPPFFDPDKKYPVVTYVYGGPSAPTVVNAWQWGSRGYYHQLLADSGAIVFLVDNRSAAGKSKLDANTILRQLFGPVELGDLLDGIAWLKSRPYVDPERVGIWGWSGGGTMTLQAMTSSREFVAGVSVAPVTDWHYYDTIYTERYMKRPIDNEEGYESTSNVKRADELNGRLLLVHGTYDDNVHPQNTWAFSNGLIEAGITLDEMIYPMRKHPIRDDAAQRHVFTTMYEFWKRNLHLGDQP